MKRIFQKSLKRTTRLFTLTNSVTDKFIKVNSNNTITLLNAADTRTTIGAGTGSVSSVGMTVPTFLSVSGSPVTSSGTLAVSLSGVPLPVANGGTGGANEADARNNFSISIIYSNANSIYTKWHFNNPAAQEKRRLEEIERLVNEYQP